jgi:hypothetical protein
MPAAERVSTSITVGVQVFHPHLGIAIAMMPALTHGCGVRHQQERDEELG